MLKLTQITKYYDPRTVYIAARHIVAIYPDMQGAGCCIELSTNGADDQGVIHVKEDSKLVADMFVSKGVL